MSLLVFVFCSSSFLCLFLFFFLLLFCSYLFYLTYCFLLPRLLPLVHLTTTASIHPVKNIPTHSSLAPPSLSILPPSLTRNTTCHHFFFCSLSQEQTKQSSLPFHSLTPPNTHTPSPSLFTRQPDHESPTHSLTEPGTPIHKETRPGRLSMPQSRTPCSSLPSAVTLSGIMPRRGCQESVQYTDTL